MTENTTDLMTIAKTWLQREEQFPIDFDEIWERAGYTLRVNAVRAFEKCIANFALVASCDHLSLLITRSNGGIPTRSFKMTIGTAKAMFAKAC